MNNETKLDHEIAREELKKLCESTLPQAIIRLIDANAIEDKWAHRAWLVTIDGQAFSWKTGMGIKGSPCAWEVLARVCAEAEDANQSFDDWCGCFGYEADSRKALEIYLSCQSGGAKVLKIMGVTRTLMGRLAELSNRL